MVQEETERIQKSHLQMDSSFYRRPHGFLPRGQPMLTLLILLLLLMASIEPNPGPSFPCTFCSRGTGAGSIQSSHCNNWVHLKRWSGLSRMIDRHRQSYICPVCRNDTQQIDGLKVLQLNINGLRRKSIELAVFMHTHDIKIAAIQGTKLDANCKLPTFHNYIIIRKDHSNTGGGLALLVHSSVWFRELDIRNPLDDTTTECQVISIDTANGPLNIYNIYIPSRSSCPNGFIPSTSHLLLNEDSLILGDLNDHDDLWNSSINDERGHAIADEISNSEFCVINENLPTRVSSNGQPTSPEVSIVSASLLTSCTWTTYTELSSDHLPRVIDILLAEEGIFTDRKTYYNLAKADWPKFTEFCEQKFNTAAEVQNLPEKWKISPYDKNIFKKCPPREKCFLQGKLFSLERKKKFSKISPRYINFQNFPRTAVCAHG